MIETLAKEADEKRAAFDLLCKVDATKLPAIERCKVEMEREAACEASVAADTRLKEALRGKL